MKGFPRISLSTTFVSIRLALGKRRDSSAGLGAAAFFAETGAEGPGWSLQETSSAARVVSKATGVRMVRSIQDVQISGASSRHQRLRRSRRHPKSEIRHPKSPYNQSCGIL